MTESCRMYDDPGFFSRSRALSLSTVVLLAALSLRAGTCLAQEPAGSTSAPAGRVLHFPKDRSVGLVKIQGIDVPEPTGGTWPSRMYTKGWEFVAEARGDVRIPPNRRVGLEMNRGVWRRPSDLRELRPNDLYMLQSADIDDRAGPTDWSMAQVGEFTGLRILHLNSGTITHRGLRNLTGLTRLKELRISSKRLGNPGLAVLAKMNSLERLSVTGKRISDAGLAYLSKMKSLQRE